jgi:hypothetical protein
MLLFTLGQLEQYIPAGRVLLVPGQVLVDPQAGLFCQPGALQTLDEIF